MYSAIYGEYEVTLRVPALRASVKFVCIVLYIYMMKMKLLREQVLSEQV